MGEGTGRGPSSLVQAAVLTWPGAGSAEHTSSTFTLENELLEGRTGNWFSSHVPFLSSRVFLAVRLMKS